MAPDGIEAFAPHPEGSSEDPFVVAFADDRRLGASAAEAARGRARTALVVAVLVLLAGLVSIVAVGDDDSDDLATSQPTLATASTSTSIRRATTSSSLRPTVTFGTPTTPTTTSLFGPGVNPSVSVPTTRFRPVTSLPVATTATTAPVGNQPLVVTISVEPAQPVAGQVAAVKVRFVDQDAPASANCRSLDFGDDTATEDPCAEPACQGQGGAAGGGRGGGVEVTYQHVWGAPGEYQVVASGESLQPYCGDRFGSEATATLTVTVTAPPTTSTPTTAPIVP